MSKKPTPPRAKAPSKPRPRAAGKKPRPMQGGGGNPRLEAWLKEGAPAKRRGKPRRSSGGLVARLRAAWGSVRFPWLRSGGWSGLSPLGRRLTLGALALLVIMTGGLVAEHLGYDSGVSRAARAFRLAVGLEHREDETFIGCLKGAAEGAFSSAVPVAEIVAAGELMLASPPLVILGAGLGCSLGAAKSVALEGVGWAVHTGSDIASVVLGR